MKQIFSLVCFIAVSAISITAFAFDLKDPAILGEYTSAKPMKGSEIERAELVYNSANQLVLLVDRGVGEYELSGPDNKGLIFDGTDEANCDGDESACYYDAETKIKLGSTLKAGKELPQLTVTITVSYAWGENCGGQDENGDDQSDCEDETTSYVLHWNKALPHNIPFYTDYANPKFEKVEKACKENLKGIIFEARTTSYLNTFDVCGFNNSFKYRDDFETAFPYLLKAWLGGNEKQPKEIKAREATAYFDQAKALAKAYRAPGKVTSALIIAEIEKLETALMKSDRFFVVPPMDHLNDKTKIFFVDSKNKVIVRSEFKVK